MSDKQEITRDDVARLVRGKPSKNRVGSRQIRHRLRQDELERLAIARERGYLLISRSTRTALINSWHLDCQAHKRPYVCVERVEGGFSVTASVGENHQRALLNRLDDIAALVAEISRPLERG